jgi:hypothetical protein
MGTPAQPRPSHDFPARGVRVGRGGKGGAADGTRDGPVGRIRNGNGSGGGGKGGGGRGGGCASPGCNGSGFIPCACRSRTTTATKRPARHRGSHSRRAHPASHDPLDRPPAPTPNLHVCSSCVAARWSAVRSGPVCVARLKPRRRVRASAEGDGEATHSNSVPAGRGGALRSLAAPPSPPAAPAPSRAVARWTGCPSAPSRLGSCCGGRGHPTARRSRAARSRGRSCWRRRRRRPARHHRLRRQTRHDRRARRHTGPTHHRTQPRYSRTRRLTPRRHSVPPHAHAPQRHHIHAALHLRTHNHTHARTCSRTHAPPPLPHSPAGRQAPPAAAPTRPLRPRPSAG